jgi:hypothetical protein
MRESRTPKQPQEELHMAKANEKRRTLAEHASNFMSHLSGF